MTTVLYEDNHCLVIDKPAGMPSQGDISGDLSVLDWARDYLKLKYQKPGNVFVGLVHRLDRPTSGVILLSRTTKAASRLSEQFREGQISKTYLAVCEAGVIDQSGIWEDELIKDSESNTVSLVQRGQVGGKVAKVSYEVAFRSKGQVGVILRPLTGRSHQLRVQLASRNLPIVGDSKYGSRTRLLAQDERPRIALHAARLRFKHPTREEICEIQAPLPSDWPVAAAAFGAEWMSSSMREERPDR